MSFFKQIGSQMDKEPSVVLIFYGIIFGLLYNYLPEYALPLMILLALYEITRKINWAVDQINDK